MNNEQHKPITFYFETTHGNFIRDALRRIGLPTMTHSSMGWRQNMLDTEWIAEVGKMGWPIITGDKSIQRVPEERQAVINWRCKVFMFDDSHETRTEDWAASLIVARHRVIELVEKAEGPFFVTIKRCKVTGHISYPDFITAAGGGWKPAQSIPTLVEAPPEISTKKRRPQQDAFDWDNKTGA